VDIDIRGKRMERTEVIANPYQEMAKGKGLAIAKFFLTYMPAVVVTQENIVGRGPGYVFAEAGVETIQTGAAHLREFIRQCIESL
jgi:predicted Fe-Mo cluster-binding NifX family protein